MRRISYYLTILLMAVCAAPMSGTTKNVNDFVVEKVSVSHPANLLVQMALDLSGVKVGTNKVKVLHVALCGENDTLQLPSVAVYGRQRWIQAERHGIRAEGENGYGFASSSCPEKLDYFQSIPFRNWMNVATLQLSYEELGCRNCGTASEEPVAVGTFREHIPQACASYSELAFIRPEEPKGGKTRILSGKAYVDFPVNVTQIRPDYRNNAVELHKIIATIDSVKSDADVTVDSIVIKGYASPEGSYANNEHLARERTKALVDYVMKLYAFPKSVFTTEWEAENWQGLRAFVESSNLDGKEAILTLIDSNMAPDAKEQKLKKDFPKQYAFLLANCYPALRVSDYRIRYTIRTYTEIRDIERIMKERPQNLSLHELYTLAEAYGPSSREFGDVLIMSAYMYPEDPVANLNAANASLMRGELETAEALLKKAGNSPEAEQARKMLQVLQNEKPTQFELF